MSRARELAALQGSRIFVAGHRGMVGSAIVRALRASGCAHLLLKPRDEVDLRDPGAVRAFFEAERPDHVFLAAATVGGIHANNTRPADFIYDNLAIATSVIPAAHASGCRRLLYLGSSCAYPRLAPQPIREEYLLSGALEPTNEPYAVAKIAGIKLCESFNRQYGTDFRSLMPTNLYGPGDNFDLTTAHVLPALIRKFLEAVASGASTVEVWGTGTPRREFLHVDDLASACLFTMTTPTEDYRRVTQPMASHLNVGTGSDISIAQLARLVADIAGFTGTITFNAERPDGTPRKLLDVSALHGLGWRARIGLREGITAVCEAFRRELARRP